ncbi:MAG: DUF4331 domain-containing protein, partial [Bacteroidia bacterium]
MRKTTKTILAASGVIACAMALGVWDSQKSTVEASSHREAPLIANDPLADNTDLYAFRSPDDTNTVTILANYVPCQLPQGGPNYGSFGENIRYEIHIKNDATTTGDDITYRFTFTKVNQDPTTFFNIRLNQQNLKTSYVAEKSIHGGAFTTIVASGSVPPPNIGPRSIGGAAGLTATSSFSTIMTNDIATASTGETIYCGPIDDPFFVDLGGIFDLGQTRAGLGPVDGLGHKNVHTIALKIPISSLQKSGLSVTSAANILDPNFVIGVWASASRQTTRTLSATGAIPADAGAYIQVSRIGMPLTNEAIVPIGSKDRWNSISPYAEDTTMDNYFCNPELALYMGNGTYTAAVPALAALKVQTASATAVGPVDFRNTKPGLYPIHGTPLVTGTALDPAVFGNYLLRPNRPR